MQHYSKYLKYKQKYLQLKQKLSKKLIGGNPDIYVYNGGSFSPITIGHKTVAVDAIKYLLKQNPDSIIHYHFVPTTTFYSKLSVQEECIRWEDRVELIRSVIGEIQHDFEDNKASLLRQGINVDNLRITCDTFEQDISLPTKSFLSTYIYLEEFCKHNSIRSDQVVLLYGQDNIEDICLGPYTTVPQKPNNKWANGLHLLAKYKFLFYPRQDNSINYEKLYDFIRGNIDLFTSHTMPIHCTYNTSIHSFFDPDNTKIYGEFDATTGNNDILDIMPQLEAINPVTLKDKIFSIQSTEPVNTGSSADAISIAEVSSSAVRALLVDKNVEQRNHPEIHSELSKYVTPRVLDRLINSELYINSICDKKI